MSENVVFLRPDDPPVVGIEYFGENTAFRDSWNQRIKAVSRPSRQLFADYFWSFNQRLLTANNAALSVGRIMLGFSVSHAAYKDFGVSIRQGSMVIANKARVVALMALTVAAEHDMVDPLQTAACLILATNEDLVLHNSPYLLPFPDR